VTHPEALRFIERETLSATPWQVPNGASGWNVFGWCWPRDKRHLEARIHAVAPTLEQAAEKAEAACRKAREAWGEIKAEATAA
jgi:hypothetical protein